MTNLTEETAHEHGDRFLVELIQNAYDAHPDHVTNGVVRIVLDETESPCGPGQTAQNSFREVLAELKKAGIEESHLERSRSNGFHVWIFFDRPGSLARPWIVPCRWWGTPCKRGHDRSLLPAPGTTIGVGPRLVVEISGDRGGIGREMRSGSLDGVCAPDALLDSLRGHASREAKEGGGAQL